MVLRKSRFGVCLLLALLALAGVSLVACGSGGSGGGGVDSRQDETLRWNQGKWDVQRWGH